MSDKFETDAAEIVADYEERHITTAYELRKRIAAFARQAAEDAAKQAFEECIAIADKERGECGTVLAKSACALVSAAIRARLHTHIATPEPKR